VKKIGSLYNLTSNEYSDTSIEFVHEYFNGYLKVSVEELHITLADGVVMLIDIKEIGRQEESYDELAFFIDVCTYAIMSKVFGQSLLRSNAF